MIRGGTMNYSPYFQQYAWGARRRPPGEWLPTIQKRADRGGINWGDPYEQFGEPHWSEMNRGDFLDRLLEMQHMLSPMRAPLSHEPEMRQQFGPPVINDYGKLRFPDVNIPLNWRLREMVPGWGEPDPEGPRPGGTPTEAYPWIG